MFDSYKTYEYDVVVLNIPDKTRMNTKALSEWELIQLVFDGENWVHVFKREFMAGRKPD
tara:strand:- start:345 stop:521 length:177 start_codon:yes stop_codon:yes gene_type:complete